MPWHHVVLPALRLVPLPMVTKMGTTVKRVLMSQPLWSAVPCLATEDAWRHSQMALNMGDIHGYPICPQDGSMMLYALVVMGKTCHASVCILGYPSLRHANHGYGMAWVNMVLRPADCGEFISIPHYHTLPTIPFHLVGTYFDRFSHDFRCQIIPKWSPNIPDASWLTCWLSSQVALALAQLSGKQQAQLRELKVELCAQGARKFTTFPCWTPSKTTMIHRFHFFP